MSTSLLSALQNTGQSSTLSQLTSTATGTSSASTSSASTDPSQQLNQQFLTLLVAQMNNQDPLNPVDNSELTSQMAQISTVTGINNVNSTVNQLISQFQQLETMQAAQLSGKSALVPGTTMTIASGSTTGATFAGQLASAADTVTATISNANGQVIRTMQLGSQAAGTDTFQWDGNDNNGSAVAAGSYTLALSASSGGSAVTVTPYTAQTITGASTGSSGTVQLNLASGGTVPMSSVAQFL